MPSSVKARVTSHPFRADAEPLKERDAYEPHSPVHSACVVNHYGLSSLPIHCTGTLIDNSVAPIEQAHAVEDTRMERSGDAEEYVTLFAYAASLLYVVQPDAAGAQGRSGCACSRHGLVGYLNVLDITTK
jgi:hypothetical protein